MSHRNFPAQQPTASPRRGLGMTSIFATVAVLVLVLLGVLLVRPSADKQLTTSEDVYTVRRGSFQIKVPASGELQALRQIEIKNQLDTRAVITEIVDEGSLVKKGEVLVRFNDESLRIKIKEAEDAVDVANNNVETAEASLAVQRKKNESELAAAEVKVNLAQLALDSWENGQYLTTKHDAALRVRTAEKEFERAKERFEAAGRLLEQDFLSRDDYLKDQITLIRAESDLETAKLEEKVYLTYDSVREREEKESDLKQASEERDRIKERHLAEIASAESNLRIGRSQLDSKKEWLQKWVQQLEFCEVTAPSDGLVVYASSMETGRHGRRGDNTPPQVGTEVPRNQTIMILPDVSDMIASVKVNEALSGLIEEGQPATVRCDALPDAALRGTVHSVGVLAETGSWRDPNRRDYTVRILLERTDGLDLKPSMKCRAQVAVGSVEDAPYLPVQAAFHDGRTSYVYVATGGGYEQRAVSLGRASELYTEITQGVEEGDRVLLREPSEGEVRRRLEAPSKDEKSRPRQARGGPGSGGPKPDRGSGRS